MADLKRFIIIDANSIIHRAYHALPPLSTKKGEQVGAVYGFLLVFFKVLKDFQPDFIAAAFDLPSPTFRHNIYKEYKATRPKTPEELSEQIPKVKEILKVFGVQIFEKEGFEADDIIGTISKAAPGQIKEAECIILSGDLDVLQLVDLRTKVYALRKGVKDTILYDEAKIKEKYEGLGPGQLVDFKALKGDPSDNVPGVKGVGGKTALELIKEFNSVENLYKKLEGEAEGTLKIRPRLKEILFKQKDQAFLSKKLLQIKKDVPVDCSFQRYQPDKIDKEKIAQIFQQLEFNSLLKRLYPQNLTPFNEEEEPASAAQIRETKKLW